MKGHTGAARLALEGGIPVVPMAHWGAHEVFPRYAKRFHLFPRKTSRVLIGDPVDLSRFEGRPLDKATLMAATEVIMDAITGLLAELRGEQPPAQRWDPAAHNQSKHGRDCRAGRKVTPVQRPAPALRCRWRCSAPAPGEPLSPRSSPTPPRPPASNADIRLWGRRGEVVEQINLATATRST